jgi:hypothetical protein
MRTRKTFIHEDGIYEGISRLPEQREIHSKEVVTLDNSYDWYPERDNIIKKESVKFEGTIDLPLGEEYKLKSQIDNYNLSNYRDSHVRVIPDEEINDIAV